MQELTLGIGFECERTLYWKYELNKIVLVVVLKNQIENNTISYIIFITVWQQLSSPLKKEVHSLICMRMPERAQTPFIMSHNDRFIVVTEYPDIAIVSRISMWLDLVLEGCVGDHCICLVN